MSTAHAKITTIKPKTSPAATPTPREVWRQADLAAARMHLETEYWWHVVRPLLGRGYPAPEPHKRLIIGRKLEWDYCWMHEKLAVEIQGGVWLGPRGGHSSAAGLMRDAAKLNELTCIGWGCLFITAAQIADGSALGWTERALRAAGARR